MGTRSTNSCGAAAQAQGQHCPGPGCRVHLLWRCQRRSVRLCQRSAPSASVLEDTGLTCDRGRWSGPCTLARDEDEGPCILRGCHSEVERTGLRHKAEPLCRGRPLLPDYPERRGKRRGGKRTPLILCKENSSPESRDSSPSTLSRVQ